MRLSSITMMGLLPTIGLIILLIVNLIIIFWQFIPRLNKRKIKKDKNILHFNDFSKFLVDAELYLELLTKEEYNCLVIDNAKIMFIKKKDEEKILYSIEYTNNKERESILDFLKDKTEIIFVRETKIR